MQFGVGVIGATGFIGTPYREQIRAAPDDARIVALCARRRDLLEAAAREDGAEFVTTDWMEIVEHPQVNLVVVAVPDALHHEMVMACARAGKHVVCEKPVATTARQAREMWSAYQTGGLGHFVPFWTRGLPVFAKARELIAAGELGEIRAFVYRWHNPRPAAMPSTWRDDAQLSTAGSVADGGSHAYDTLRWLTGLEARRVLAHADVITPPKPDLGAINLDEALTWAETRASGGSSDPPTRKGTAFDYGAVATELDNGSVGVFAVSHAPYLRTGLAPDLELHGDQASLSVDRLAGTLRLARPQEDPVVAASLETVGAANQFAAHAFPAIRAHAAGRPTDEPGLHDGWRVQLFTDAVVASAKRGGWVSIDEFDTDV